MNHYQFPVKPGTLAITWNSRGMLFSIDWYDNCAPVDHQASQSHGIHSQIPVSMANLVLSLRDYFRFGEPIGEIPWSMIDRQGMSDFQVHVYEAICEIPHGETRTYAWVARRVSLKTRKFAAPRAVGQALRRNPLPIVIPCHRVVAANALGGFMGISDPDQPELVFKKWLIEAESGYRNPMFAFLPGLGKLAAAEAVG